MKKKVGCMNCKGTVEFERNEYKKQIITCGECGGKMSVRPYKNGSVAMYNLEVR